MDPFVLVRSFVLSSLVLPLAAQAPPAKHVLRHALQPGKSQFYRQTMVSQMVMNIGGHRAATDTTMETVVELKVLAVKDGKAEVQQTIHRIVVKIGYLEIDYDSDVAGSDPGPMREVTGLVGTSSTFQMDERGMVTEVKLPQSDYARALFGRCGPEQLARDMPAFPDAPVAVGGTWEETVPMPSVVRTAECKVTHKLVDVERGKAVIEQEMADTGKGAERGGLLEFSRGTGTMVVDLATGRLLERRTTMVAQRSSAAPVAVTQEATLAMTLLAIDAPLPKGAEKKAPKPVPGHAVAAPLAARQEAHLLRRAFVPGKSQFFRQTIVTDTDQKFLSDGGHRKTKVELTLELEVLAVEGGKASVQLTVRRVLGRGLDGVPYDSDAAGAVPAGIEDWVKLVGKATTAKVDGRGNFSGVKLAPGFQVVGWGAWSGAGLVGVLQALADAPVAVGGGWEASIVAIVETFGFKEAKATNKLVRVEGGRATIEQQLAMVAKDPEQVVTRHSGVTVMDIATGAIVEANVDLEAEYRSGGKPAVTVKQNVKTVAIDKPAPAKKGEDR